MTSLGVAKKYRRITSTVEISISTEVSKISDIRNGFAPIVASYKVSLIIPPLLRYFTAHEGKNKSFHVFPDNVTLLACMTLLFQNL